MTAIVLIPARYGSHRFPGKPLAMIAGKTLIERVYERAGLVKSADVVCVATDDERIAGHVRSFGGQAIVTAGEFATGTDRIAYALRQLEQEGAHYDQIVNLQGDEPLIDTEAVDRIIEALRAGRPIVTLACPLANEDEFQSPDVVKVVTDLAGDALYFSRSPIPHRSRHESRRHVGIYGFLPAVLQQLASLPSTALERAERLEQLRAIENGYKIRVLLTGSPHLGVDRPEDVAKVESEIALAQREI